MGIEDTQKKDTRKKPSKLRSTKLWVTIWAMCIVTVIVFLNRAEYKEIAKWLCTVPLGYIGANVIQKKIFEEKEA